MIPPTTPCSPGSSVSDDSHYVRTPNVARADHRPRLYPRIARLGVQVGARARMCECECGRRSLLMRPYGYQQRLLKRCLGASTASSRRSAQQSTERRTSSRRPLTGFVTRPVMLATTDLSDACAIDPLKPTSRRYLQIHSSLSWSAPAHAGMHDKPRACGRDGTAA